MPPLLSPGDHDSEALKSVYFAGKVDSYRRYLFGDAQIMRCGKRYYERFTAEPGSIDRGLKRVKTSTGGVCLYAGPHAISDSHNTYLANHGLSDSDDPQPIGTEDFEAQLKQQTFLARQVYDDSEDPCLLLHGFPGYMANADDTSAGYRSGGFTQGAAVRRCLWQIDDCDAVHAYLDSLDCPGTIAELGYASAKGKPIYLVIAINAETTSDLFDDEKDELWFIKNLPGVVSCITGGATSIDPQLLHYPAPRSSSRN